MSEHLTPRARASRAAFVALAVLGMASFSGCASESPDAATPPSDSEVGKAFASDAGVEVSITNRICGISGVGADKPEFTAVGQYCTVGVNVDNGSEEEIDLSLLKVKGLTAGTEVFPDYWAGEAADGGMQALAAGDTVESTLFFDVPKGQLLDVIELTTPWDGIESFEVSF